MPMKRTILAVSFVVAVTAAQAQTVLKFEPPIGSVPEGKHILVDDGVCPKGQIKEVIGGNVQKQIRRQVRCIARK